MVSEARRSRRVAASAANLVRSAQERARPVNLSEGGRKNRKSGAFWCILVHRRWLGTDLPGRALSVYPVTRIFSRASSKELFPSGTHQKNRKSDAI